MSFFFSFLVSAFFEEVFLKKKKEKELRSPYYIIFLVIPLLWNRLKWQFQKDFFFFLCFQITQTKLIVNDVMLMGTLTLIEAELKLPGVGLVIYVWNLEVCFLPKPKFETL